MNIYQMIKNSNCFTMTIFLMFKMKLVRLKGISGLKCPYAWVKKMCLPISVVIPWHRWEVVVNPGVVFFNRNDTIPQISFPWGKRKSFIVFSIIWYCNHNYIDCAGGFLPLIYTKSPTMLIAPLNKFFKW